MDGSGASKLKEMSNDTVTRKDTEQSVSFLFIINIVFQEMLA